MSINYNRIYRAPKLIWGFNLVRSGKEFRWVFKSKNGRITAISSESYKRKQACVKAVKSLSKFIYRNSHYCDHTGPKITLVVYE